MRHGMLWAAGDIAEQGRPPHLRERLPEWAHGHHTLLRGRQLNLPPIVLRAQHCSE